MQKNKSNQYIYSATDIVNFLECAHLTTLDLQDIHEKLPRAQDDDHAKLIQDKGFAHEKDFVEKLQGKYSSFIDISKESTEPQARADATLEAMKKGTQIIFQATFIQGEFLGYADFLRRVPTPSTLGDYSYEVLDTKLARSVKAKFVIQLSFYSEMVAKVQGVHPQHMYVILGNGNEAALKCSNFTHFYQRLKKRFLEEINSKNKNTYPDPCEYCDICRWRDLCAKRWEVDDHLSQVANILKVQIKKLEGAGIKTLAALAQIDPALKISKMAQPIVNKLHHQARLQYQARIDPIKRETGIYELIEPQPGDIAQVGPRGMGRMPAPDDGDLFFDMEGNPLEDGGLEYLFGLYFIENNEPVFKAFWAHSREDEKVAFENFMDFVTDRLVQYPNAHIYHYAPYEVTALKKLMGLHGTRESAVDALLRNHKMVDLYQVVREAIRVSEPRYSIKNIERFYLEKRTGEVTNAGASIVFYEKWKETQDAKLLTNIEDYNKEDVRSTYELRDWLLELRPNGMPWVSYQKDEVKEKDQAKTERVANAEKKLNDYRLQLTQSISNDEKNWTVDEQHRVLTYQLLDFHRRTAKPEWWGFFERQAMSTEERLEHPECIAAMIEQIGEAVPEAKSKRYTFRYPEQEIKLKMGDKAVLADSGKAITGLILDEVNQTVSFKITDTSFIEAGQTDIGTKKTINADILVNALYRYAESVVNKTGKYAAIDALLKRQLPNISGHTAGTPLVPEPVTVDQVTAVVKAMNDSYLFIQGPPGAGKTFTGSHVIVALLKAGKSVGITSNSHKAILNLLHAVERVAIECNFKFYGLKKSDPSNNAEHINGSLIKDSFDNKRFIASNAKLKAGTAWAMSDADLDQKFDYLFVDEAGQVSLGHLIPMATSSKNIILLGDQMQLSQPTKGVHPGDSGLSVLDYLLKGQATVAPDHGIFLSTTWRMHPKVCEFISDAIYDSRLHPESRNATRSLILNESADPALKQAGIRYIPVKHAGCTQHSQEEVDVIKALFFNLLTQSFTDEIGTKHPITAENILIVSPYNMQVNKLKLALPLDARIGTVDKFQGQEAEVVIISMATSSSEDLPRDIEFLFSKNRLNVAVSRAKCLALLIASPALLDINCKTPQQMELVNTLCWLTSIDGYQY